jgi:hypothetical protein
MQRRKLVSLGVFVASLTAIGLTGLRDGPGVNAAGSHQIVPPTVIVQTAVPTATPTATATATATPAGKPLAAIPVGVATLAAHRHGDSVVFNWRMLGQEQVRGFKLYAGKTTINRGLIPVHASLVYQRQVRWSGHGRFGLGVVFVSGQQITVRVR